MIEFGVREPPQEVTRVVDDTGCHSNAGQGKGLGHVPLARVLMVQLHCVHTEVAGGVQHQPATRYDGGLVAYNRGEEPRGGHGGEGLDPLPGGAIQGKDVVSQSVRGRVGLSVCVLVGSAHQDQLPHELDHPKADHGTVGHWSPPVFSRAVAEYLVGAFTCLGVAYVGSATTEVHPVSDSDCLPKDHGVGKVGALLPGQSSFWCEEMQLCV